MDQYSLGEAIRQIRISRKLTQAELAELSGLHRTYLSSVERGTRNLSLAVLKTLSIALDVPLSSIAMRAERIARESKELD